MSFQSKVFQRGSGCDAKSVRTLSMAVAVISIKFYVYLSKFLLFFY